MPQQNKPTFASRRLVQLQCK